MNFVIILTTLLATILGSISGVGGGVLIKPVMDAILNLGTRSISFISGATVFTMTIASLIRSRKEHFDSRTLTLAIGGAFGGYIGKLIFDIALKSQNTYRVSLIQNWIMVFLTLAVLIYTIFKTKIPSLNIKNKFISILIGFLLGVISAFLGIGGGPINIMILSLLFSMDSKMAARVSLTIIFLSQLVSLSTSLILQNVPEIDYLLLISMMIVAVLGATLGRTLSKKMNNRTVDILFIFLLSIIVFVSIYNVVTFSLILKRSAF